MVVFTCGHCGESVQKPKVEKHYLTKCRSRNPNLSCMDCFKDFFGQDYQAHNKCITEEERYSGKGYVSKEKKGEKKQNTWVEMLQSVLDEQPNAPSNVLKIIETVSKHTNTPRKKPKFINFVKNVCGNKTNPKDMDKAWDLISVKLNELSNATRNQNQNKEPSNETKDLEDGVSEDKGEPKEKEVEQLVDANELETKAQAEESGDSSETDKKKMTKKQMREEKKRLKYEAELKSAVERPEEVTEKAETKKQIREEKKRQKQEAVLKSATEKLEDEEVETKKDKKKKNRLQSHSDENVPTDEKKDIEDEITEELEAKNDKKKKNRLQSQSDENVPTNGKKNKNKKRKRQDTVGSNCHVEPCDTLENVAPSNPHAEKTQKKKQRMEEENADESIALHDQNVANIGKLTMTSNDQFDWHGVIIAVLQKKDNEIPFKRLQKKVLEEYSQTTGMAADDRIAEKFIKKVKSAKNVVVEKNKVSLLC